MSNDLRKAVIGVQNSVRRPFLCLAIIFLALFAVATCSADDSFVVRATPATIADIASRHNLELVGSLDSQQQVYLLRNTSGESQDQMETELEADGQVLTCEPNAQMAVSESATLNQSTAAILDSTPSFPVNYFGSIVPSRYRFQPATALLRLRSVQNDFGVTGRGIVAVIDTGVDPNHPALAGSLLPGHDFVNDLDGTASEFIDLSPAASAILNQSTAAILDQSTAAILDFSSVVMVNQSTAAILDQSTAAILDASQLPAAFGHGTMVAGIVHLTAPTAQIMPLKAFGGDGTGELSNILRAIYYAVDHNAKVLNMSFSLQTASPELVSALNYATQNGVILVASVGNTGQLDVSYPAALSNVLGVGSTSNLDLRSTFSSIGPMVFLGAPGEGIVTTYPGNHYAAAWGTSFSSPFVAGGAALVSQLAPNISQSDAALVLGHARSVPLMGRGRMDLYQAIKRLD